MDLRKLASILRRKTHVGNLMKGSGGGNPSSMSPATDSASTSRTIAAASGARIVKRGQDPERPSLGAVARLKTRETFEVTEEEGVHQVVVRWAWAIRRRADGRCAAGAARIARRSWIRSGRSPTSCRSACARARSTRRRRRSGSAKKAPWCERGRTRGVPLRLRAFDFQVRRVWRRSHRARRADLRLRAFDFELSTFHLTSRF